MSLILGVLFVKLLWPSH